ncbi:MAG: hypothetical protein COB83_10690 [Gammaproteobacteria bacterium]|nr:MAG: hypothetical protein COB83_10690 [Gammaproteobacteria bacterium]
MNLQAVPLLLIDEQKNTQVRVLSEYDVFFVIEGVPHGIYQLVVEPAYLARKGYKIENSPNINITKDNELTTLDVGILYLNKL